jgi:large subunit ribosomal protein L16
MLSPKKPKYRKQMKQVRHIRGVADRGVDLAFGDYGLRVVEGGWISARHVEAGRIAIARTAKRGGMIWIKIFPDKPLTSKPAETRMGKGKGAPEEWVAEVRAGKIIYELTGVNEALAKRALRLAAAKMPVRCVFVARSEYLL